MLKWLNNASDAIEIAAVAVLGTGLFLGLFIGVPALLVRELLSASRHGLASLIAACSLLTVAALCRDLLARRWSAVSRIVIGGWALCLVFVFVRLTLME